MVSNAREDLPEPETPVTTVRVLWGMEKSMFFRLWTRAPRTTMLSVDIRKGTAASPAWPQNAQRSRQKALASLRNPSIIRHRRSGVRGSGRGREARTLAGTCPAERVRVRAERLALALPVEK